MRKQKLRGRVTWLGKCRFFWVADCWFYCIRGRPWGKGRVWTGTEGKERAFMDEEQNVHMHGGGHMRRTQRVLFWLKTLARVGETGKCGWWGRISCCCVLLRDTEKQETAGSTPKEFTGWLGRQNRCRKVSTRLVAMRIVGTMSAARVLRRYSLWAGVVMCQVGKIWAGWSGFRLRQIRFDWWWEGSGPWRWGAGHAWRGDWQLGNSRCFQETGPESQCLLFISPAPTLVYPPLSDFLFLTV